jgi:hypothetical protein
MENSVELTQVLAQITWYQYLANSHQIQLQCLGGIYDHALDLTAIKGSAQYCIGTGPNLHPKGKSEPAPNSFKSLIPRPSLFLGCAKGSDSSGWGNPPFFFLCHNCVVLGSLCLEPY